MAGVVVGTDGSRNALRALRWAVDEARLRRTGLTVLAVVPVPVTLSQISRPMVGEPEAADVRAAEASAKEAVAEIGADDVQVAVRVVGGVPAEELVNASADADLLVVGSRGGGGFSRLLLGSVSSQVVHHTRCPVTVVPDKG